MIQTFLNGQLFYFTFAYFWSNVGYDILRELIPFTFEQIHVDASKIIITSIYLFFYCFNVNWMNNFTINHTGHNLAAPRNSHLHPF